MEKPIIAMSKTMDGNMSFKYEGYRSSDTEKVRKNRKTFLDKNNILEDKIFYMKPEHGTVIKSINNGHLKTKSELSDVGGISCDGLYTTKKGIALAFPPADCMPIFFWNSKVVAIVHAGRTGILEDLPKKMLLTLIREHFADNYKNPISIQVGHHIHSCCYRFPWEFFWEWGFKFPFSTLPRKSKFVVNLKGQLFRSFHDFVHGGFIHLYNNDSECTCCTKDEEGNYKYFSHVRCNLFPGKHAEGRNLAVIMRL